MEHNSVREAINDRGVISVRDADVVAPQDDHRFVGVADVVFDYRIKPAVEA
jgi:hypothetical protein